MDICCATNFQCDRAFLNILVWPTMNGRVASERLAPSLGVELVIVI
jgi:hypothetical protein